MDCLPDSLQVGARIRQQRAALGYTRETLSEKLGVTPKFCADLELGLKGMFLSTLCRLSDVLHLSTDYILFGRSEPEDTAAITDMLRHCAPEKLPYARQILLSYLRSHENNI